MDSSTRAATPARVLQFFSVLNGVLSAWWTWNTPNAEVVVMSLKLALHTTIHQLASMVSAAQALTIEASCFSARIAVPTISAVGVLYLGGRVAYSRRLMLLGALRHLFSGNLSRDVRAVVRGLPLEPPRPREGHTHPNAAAHRVSFRSFAESFCRSTNTIPHYLSGTRAEVERGLGDNLLYFPNDAKARLSLPPVLYRADATVIMVDVDYYIDWRQYLWSRRNFLLYTFCPRFVAGGIVDGVFYTNEQDEVVVTNMGSSSYQHSLWDYAADYWTVDYWYGSEVYSVERRTTQDPDRRIVLLNHVRTIWTPLLGYTLPGDRPKRVRTVIKMGNHIIAIKKTLMMTAVRSYDDKGEPVEQERMVNMVSFGLPGHNVHSVITEEALTSATVRVAHEKASGGSIQFHTRIDPSGFGAGAESRASGCLAILLKNRGYLSQVYQDTLPAVFPSGDPKLVNHFIAALEGPRAPAVTPINADDGTAQPPVLPSSLRHQRVAAAATAAPGTHLQELAREGPAEALPSMQVLCAPIFPGGVAPANCAQNDIACIGMRVLDQTNPDGEVPACYDRWADEFIARTLGEAAGKMHPIGLDEVRALQLTPAQKNRAAQHWDVLQTNLTADFGVNIQAFQKAEAYAIPNAPRNICQLPLDLTIRMGAFIYPLSDQVLKATPWYAFGLSPKDVAARVHLICRRSKLVANTDYSKFDGTIGAWLNEKETTFFQRAFAPEFVAELTQLCNGMTNIQGSTKHAISFVLWYARVTGSSQTSAANSFSNALVCYCAQRYNRQSPAAAWRGLGLYGGDDGLTPITDGLDKALEHVAAVLGLKLKIEVQKPSEPLVFLGRLYPKPDHAARNCADIRRAMAKLHLSATNYGDPLLNLRDKAAAWAVTDPHTPLIRDVVRTVQQECRRRGVPLHMGDNPDVSWYFLNADGPFPILDPADADDGTWVYDNLDLPPDVVAAMEETIRSGPPAIWDFSAFADLCHVAPKIRAYVGPDLQLVGEEHAPVPVMAPLRDQRKRREDKVTEATVKRRNRAVKANAKQAARQVWVPKHGAHTKKN